MAYQLLKMSQICHNDMQLIDSERAWSGEEMNTSVDTQSLMLQMRSLAAEAASNKPSSSVPLASTDGAAKAENFADLLSNSVNAVNNEQHKAGGMKKAFEQGENVELSDVMVQVQKASLSFQAMTQVRNKLVEAYKDVMHLSI